MKLQQTALPTPEELARHMGLRDLRIGRHFLRDEAGEKTGSVSVCTLWFAEVVPSFHPRVALAAATAMGEPFNECCVPDFVKAVMATADAAHVITIDRDPMQAALNGVEFFCGDRAPKMLDGIAYTLTFQTMHLHGTLQFGNPTHSCLRSLEQALLGLAQQIAAQAGDSRLRDVVGAWHEFIHDKHE